MYSRKRHVHAGNNKLDYTKVLKKKMGGLRRQAQEVREYGIIALAGRTAE
jgi:hypothetical protein